MMAPVSQQVSARSLTKTLGGHWHGHYGTAPCPICQQERRKDQNALTLRDGDDRLLAHCKRSECSFHDILAAAGLASDAHHRQHHAPDPAAIARRETEQRTEARNKARIASRLWREALTIEGTVAERYLRNRGIAGPLPAALRLHRACRHGPSGLCLPAMIARVDGSDLPAVHRTWIEHDGSGKANVEPSRMALGGIGGGAVRLWSGAGPLAVAEGIESSLSLASGGYVPDDAAIWAALSTSGMRGLRLPESPRDLLIAMDNDRAGQNAAYALADRAHALGWKVSMIQPPPGRDFNDLLQSEVMA